MATKRMKSVFQTEKECFFCKTQRDLEEHHIFPGRSNRKKSDKRGFVVWLCSVDHRTGRASVHNNPKGPLDMCLKTMAQKYYEENIGSREDFREEFGKSFILEEE